MITIIICDIRIERDKNWALPEFELVAICEGIQLASL
jgi:hypothetical protein